MEPVSSTDRKCLWDKLKERSLDNYKPCCSQDKLPPLSEDQQEYIYNQLLICNDNSAISKHKTRTISSRENQVKLERPKIVPKAQLLAQSNVDMTQSVLNNSLHSISMRNLGSF